MKAQYLNTNEIIILNSIADQNVFVGGDGVINARAMLDKEIYEEPYVLRKRNNNLPGPLSQVSATQIENKYDIEKIIVHVIDQTGRSIYIGSYNGWKEYKRKTSASFVTVKYFYLDQPIGIEKQILIK